MSAADAAEIELIRHPAGVALGAYSVRVGYAYSDQRVLSLSYILSGAIDRLRLPEARAAERTDGLWQHTCFEAFVTLAGKPAYYEFNFSPSTQWAAYQFTSCRSGMTPAMDARPPDIRVQRETGRLQLAARVALGGLATLTGPGPLRLALAAVVESESGTLSYWALAHPREQPDFHHPDSFTIVLP